MKDKFLEILKDAYPQGFSPLYTSGASLQLWREEMAFALEAAAQQSVQSDVCPTCNGATVVLSSFGGIEDCVECGGTGKRR